MKVITWDRRKSSQLKTCLNHCYTKATFYWMFWLRLWANVRVKHWKRRTEDSFVFKKNILYLISVNIAIFVCIPCLKVSSKYLMMTKCPIPVCKTVCDVNKPSCTEWHWRGRMMPDNMTLDRGSYRVFQTLFLNLVVSIFFFSANPHLNRSPRFPHLWRTNRGQLWATYDKSKWNNFFSTFKKNK